VVGGISMGAGVALNLAFRYPQRAVGLVLSRPAWLDSPRPENIKAYPVIARLLREHGAERGRELFEGTEEYADLERATPRGGLLAGILPVR
jgi:pimeloyl-ACP methyl ester carboxylesterase